MKVIPVEKELETRLVVLRGDICRNLMLHRSCEKEVCKYIHDPSICFHHWKFDKCKYDSECKKKHVNYTSKYDKNKVKKKLMSEKKNDIHDSNNTNNKTLVKKYNNKNTETFLPMIQPVDMILSLDLGSYKDKLSVSLTDRSVILVPNLFNDYSQNIIYNKLVDEINTCGIPQEELFKLWHGDTHLIADDKLKLKDSVNKFISWKEKVPTFNMVIQRFRDFFNMDIKATRYNFYKDASQWKPFHKDAAAIKQDKADKQNFTVGVSFGTTRSAAFERDTHDKTVISIPISDGQVYAFCNETNKLWRHGILREKSCNVEISEGRISIIAWGWCNNIQST